jgi:hypothetical protein
VRAALLVGACWLIGCGAGVEAAPDAAVDVARLPPEQRDIMRQSSATARSHNAGTNCASCHSAEGNAMGFFSASGTVRRANNAPLSNASVELRTAPMGGGELLARAVTDQNGNFYTTSALPSPARPLFASLVSPSGARREMPFPTLSGQCNFCHVGRQRFRME